MVDVVSVRPRRVSSDRGFTIVELIIVIVVIGILAAIVAVAYTGVGSRATETSLLSDISSAKDQLAQYQFDNGNYPTVNNCSSPGSTEICLKTSEGNAVSYWADNSSGDAYFRVTTYKDGNYFSDDSDDIRCPMNYVIVPGSDTYGTDNFCAMKYPAKRSGTSNIPVAQAGGLPWASISQTTAISYSQNACSGCHLITEAEWLTIAQNTLSVAGNWSGGTVGSGAIYKGHSDSSPNNAIEAGIDDSNGYINTGNSSGNQRRTLTLTNGEVMWDLAGNIMQWTTGTTTGGQPGIVSGGYSIREWTALTTPGSITPDPSPAGTGLAGASSWNTTYGVGAVNSSADDTSLRGFLRSGHWACGGSGVLGLSLVSAPSYSNSIAGFRVAR